MHIYTLYLGVLPTQSGYLSVPFCSHQCPPETKKNRTEWLPKFASSRARMQKIIFAILIVYCVAYKVIIYNKNCCKCATAMTTKATAKQGKCARSLAGAAFHMNRTLNSFAPHLDVYFMSFSNWLPNCFECESAYNHENLLAQFEAQRLDNNFPVQFPPKIVSFCDIFVDVHRQLLCSLTKFNFWDLDWP